MTMKVTSKPGEAVQSGLLSTAWNWEVLFHYFDFVATWDYDIEPEKEKETAAAMVNVKPPAASASASPIQKPKGPSKRLFTLDEVKSHSGPDDIYLLIENEVYDVTEFAKTHPGGTIIYKYGGKDASDQFRAFHRPRVAGYLKKYHVGTLDSKDAPSVDQATKDYRQLRGKLWKEGYFKPNPAFYNVKHAIWAALIALSVLTITLSSNFYITTIFGGSCLGIGLQQAAFLAHDAAHHGIKEPPKKGCTNWLAWFLGSVVFGISTNMWNEEHSMHHAITVRPREDPQFNYLPIWLIDMKELENEKVDGKGGYKLNPFIKFLVGLQHFTFLPLIMIIGRVNLHAISVGFELKNIFLLRKHKEGLIGLLGMCVYWCWHLSILSLLPTTKERLVFSIASHLSAGILHVQLLLSHLNVDTMDEEEEDEAGFFRFQMAVSRNIDVHWAEHWFHGGLEYQIEHHLFPQLPRHELANVKPMVLELCKKHGVRYRNDGFVEATVGVLGNMKKLAWAIVTLDQ